MSDKNKSNKKTNKLYNRDEAHRLTDMMIVFIGMCILVLAFLSLYGTVPEEYAFGATLAGFFFVFSDVLLVEEKITPGSLLMYGLSLLSGVASFVLLPVILLMNAPLREIIMKDSDFFTFLGLGFVLMTIGYKTLVRNFKKQEEESNEIEKMKVELSKLIERHEENSQIIEELKSELTLARLQITEAITSDK